MPSLEEIMGSSYHENMTSDEINSFFENRLLATGKYENKEKVDAERKKNSATIKELQTKIQGNLSEDELKKQETEALKAEIEQLKESQKLSRLETSRLKAEGSLAETKVLMGITDDKEYKKFIENISDEDSSKTDNISKYINKLVKDAYEKGKAEGTKKSLGEMGKQYSKGSSQDDGNDKDLQLVKKMESFKPVQKEFKKSNFI